MKKLEIHSLVVWIAFGIGILITVGIGILITVGMSIWVAVGIGIAGFVYFTCFTVLISILLNLSGVEAKISPALALFNNPGKIYISGRINTDLAKKVTNQINYFKKNAIYDGIVVVIDSMGGVTDSATLICNTMKKCSKPIATIAVNKALSAAATILCHGNPGRRYALLDSSIFLHQAGCRPSNKTRMTEKSLLATLRKVMKANETQYQQLADNTPWSITQIKKFLQKDRWMTPVQAVELRLIDFVIP